MGSRSHTQDRVAWISERVCTPTSHLSKGHQPHPGQWAQPLHQPGSLITLYTLWRQVLQPDYDGFLTPAESMPSTWNRGQIPLTSRKLSATTKPSRETCSPKLCMYRHKREGESTQTHTQTHSLAQEAHRPACAQNAWNHTQVLTCRHTYSSVHT